MSNEENIYIAIHMEWWDVFKKLAFKDALISNVIELEEKHSKIIKVSDEQLEELLEK